MTPTRWFCLTHKDTVKVGSQMSEGCDVYELHPVGGLHVDRVPCDNCNGRGHGAFGPQGQLVAPGGGKYPCPSCVDGMTWPDWAMTAMMGIVVDLPEPDQALDRLMRAQEGDKP